MRTFALITNTLAKDKEIEDEWRGFARPISARNLGNRVEDEVVDALIAAVEAAAPRLAHRYYALKARWMGTDALDYWDPQRAAARGRRPHRGLEPGGRHRAERLPRLLAHAREHRLALLRQ